MNATKARGKRNTAAPIPDKGVLVRKPATCDQCKKKCVAGGQLGVTDAYYTYYDEKLCKVCIKGVV